MSKSPDWFRIGHVTHAADRTGCTVILFEDLIPTVVDVRGGAPGTRETELLQPGRRVGHADAILLTGGSAFGLAAADGVVRWLSQQGRGIPTSAGTVPIVPAAVIFDLAVGTRRHPNADDGYRAISNARVPPPEVGLVGAGCGATVAKLGGGSGLPGGFAVATVSSSAGDVTAAIVLNAVGDVRDPQLGDWLARSRDVHGVEHPGRDLALRAAARALQGENTTIGVILISAPASRDALVRAAISAHDGLARCVYPAHTLFDGDTFFVSARSDGESDPADVLALATASEMAVERAIVGIFQDRDASRTPIG